MERLTKKSRRYPYKFVSAIGSGYGAWPQIIDRLAAYENTGLEPEEVEALMKVYQHIILEKKSHGKTT